MLASPSVPRDTPLVLQLLAGLFAVCARIMIDLVTALFPPPKKEGSRSPKKTLFPRCNLHEVTTRDLSPCATGFDSGLVSFKNSKGEVEFKMVDSVQQPSPISDVSSPLMKGMRQQQQGMAGGRSRSGLTDFVALSPVSSVKSSESGSSSMGMEAGAGDKKGGVSSKVHRCPYCEATFRIRGYLTRHMKKHSKRKAYRCPFYDPGSPQKCHATGGFSRRDTYKTHLKARHFRYPPGVKSGERTGMMGWCAVCGEKFINNEIWVEHHIEMGVCPGLPADYVKSLKIGKKKTGKHSKLLDAIPDARFFQETDFLPAAGPKTEGPVSHQQLSVAVNQAVPTVPNPPVLTNSGSFSSLSSLSSNPVPYLSMTWNEQKPQQQQQMQQMQQHENMMPPVDQSQQFLQMQMQQLEMQIRNDTGNSVPMPAPVMAVQMNARLPVTPALTADKTNPVSAKSSFSGDSCSTFSAANSLNSMVNSSATDEALAAEDYPSLDQELTPLQFQYKRAQQQMLPMHRTLQPFQQMQQQQPLQQQQPQHTRQSHEFELGFQGMDDFSCLEDLERQIQQQEVAYQPDAKRLQQSQYIEQLKQQLKQSSEDEGAAFYGQMPLV